MQMQKAKDIELIIMSKKIFVVLQAITRQSRGRREIQRHERDIITLPK